jgi:hypothetical protein
MGRSKYDVVVDTKVAAVTVATLAINDRREGLLPSGKGTVEEVDFNGETGDNAHVDEMNGSSATQKKRAKELVVVAVKRVFITDCGNLSDGNLLRGDALE